MMELRGILVGCHMVSDTEMVAALRRAMRDRPDIEAEMRFPAFGPIGWLLGRLHPNQDFGARQCHPAAHGEQAIVIEFIANR